MSYGLKACKINKTEENILEKTERQIIRNFARLPQSTPMVALYIEFGITPITHDIKIKKLIMWKRMQSRRGINTAINSVITEQCFNNLPWFDQLMKSA